MNVLFIHNGSPGRFAYLAQALTSRGWNSVLINGPEGTDLPNTPTIRWSGEIMSRSQGLAVETEKAMLRGAKAAQVALSLKNGGFEPNLIIGHPAWGEMLYLSQVYPNIPQIQVGEFFFKTAGTHFQFDPEFSKPSLGNSILQHSVNASHALSYTDATRIVAPTRFQANTYPKIFQPIIDVIHEGVDTRITRNLGDMDLHLENGEVINTRRPIVTFINRHFEPMRGFHIFMRSLPALLNSIPDAKIILVGNDAPDGYGQPPTSGSWKQTLLQELGPTLATERVHFVGTLPYEKLVRLLSISACHVHFSYPTVLSWSLLDAMACSCLVIGSNTDSVSEVLKDGQNGILIDFFDVDGLARAMIETCKDGQRFIPLRHAARRTVTQHYDRETVCLPAWLRLIDQVIKA